MHSEREPARDERDPAERRDRTEEARRSERKRVQTAAEQRDTDDERDRRATRRRCCTITCEYADTEQRERVPELVVDRGMPDHECTLVKYAAQRMRAKCTKRDGQGAGQRSCDE